MGQALEFPRHCLRPGSADIGQVVLPGTFFFFAEGGYHGAQGYALPGSLAAWSLWEYFTGFFAGGIVTAFLLNTAGRAENTLVLLTCENESAEGGYLSRRVVFAEPVR